MQRLWLVALIAIVPVLPACKKKEAAGTGSGSGSAGSAAEPAGSGSAMAGSAAAPAGSGSGSGSGSAAAAGSGSGSGSGSAGSGSAAAAEPPMAPPPAGKIAVKRGGKDKGVFDGDKAFYVKHDKDRKIVAVQNCDKFTCADFKQGDVDTDKLAKVCSNASWFVIKLNGSTQPGEPKVGAVKVEGYNGSFMSGGDLTSDWTDGGTLDEVTPAQIKGKIDLKDGDSEAHGTFVAKTCK